MLAASPKLRSKKAPPSTPCAHGPTISRVPSRASAVPPRVRSAVYARRLPRRKMSCQPAMTSAGTRIDSTAASAEVADHPASRCGRASQSW